MNKQISLSVVNNELAQVRNKKKMLLKQIEHIAFGENCSPWFGRIRIIIKGIRQ